MQQQQHVQSIMSLVIHVVIDDYECNALLGNDILVQLLQLQQQQQQQQQQQGVMHDTRSNLTKVRAAYRSIYINPPSPTLSLFILLLQTLNPNFWFLSPPLSPKKQACEYQVLIDFGIDMFKALSSGGGGAKNNNTSYINSNSNSNSSNKKSGNTFTKRFELGGDTTPRSEDVV